MNSTKLKEVLTADAFVGYVDKRMPLAEESSVLQEYFPVSRITGLDFSYIKTTNGIIEPMPPSAFDAEPISQHREGFDAMKGELPLFRRKMALSEKEKAKLDLLLKAGKTEEVAMLIKQIYDDQATLISGARMTQEFLRSRVLMDGAISINSKGGAVSVDYKVPTANKHTLTGSARWSDPTAPIIDAIRNWCDDVEEATGIRPTKMIMNKHTFKYLNSNNQIKANVVSLPVSLVPVVSASAIVSDMQVRAVLQSLTGIEEIIVYNRKVRMDGVVHDLIEDNKVAMFPDGELGKTLIGTSPAEMSASIANRQGAEISVVEGGIAVNVISNTGAPYTMETQAEFVGLPSFVMSDFVIQATVA